MAEYQPLKNSQSLATSSVESSNESRILSDDELIDIEDFASFKGYSPEMDNLLVTFSLTQSIYKLDEPIIAHFYALASSFQIKPDDAIGICPMRKSVPFVKLPVAECETESNAQAVSDEIFDESDIIAKKAIFKLDQLPAELAKEFYFQFCYLNAKNEVIGISTPFRFERDGVKDCAASIESETPAENTMENYDSMVMEKREDDDFIVVSCTIFFIYQIQRNIVTSF